MENKEPNPPLPEDWKPLDVTPFKPLMAREAFIAQMKKEYPSITDAELEAYGA